MLLPTGEKDMSLGPVEMRRVAAGLGVPEETERYPGQSAADILALGADTYRERNKLYGDNYKRFGVVMDALFPGGLRIEGVTEWNRLGIFIQMMSKVTRYSQHYANGGHPDSVHDLMVYAAMMQEIDEGATP